MTNKRTKRTEKKVDTGGKPWKMVMDKAVVHVTHKDPWLIARDGVSLTLENEDNMDRIMTDLEQSQKNVAQLKETLQKERDESSNIKRKYENMIGEVKVSRTECQTLQADKDALAISAENTENNSQVTLAELQKLQLEHQSLKVEKDNLQLSFGKLNEEKNKLESKVTELGIEKATVEDKENQYQTQLAALEEQKNSFRTSLNSAMEQKVDIRPLKEHALIIRKKIHEIQLQI